MTKAKEHELLFNEYLFTMNRSKSYGHNDQYLYGQFFMMGKLIGEMGLTEEFEKWFKDNNNEDFDWDSI